MVDVDERASVPRTVQALGKPPAVALISISRQAYVLLAEPEVTQCQPEPPMGPMPSGS